MLFKKLVCVIKVWTYNYIQNKLKRHIDGVRGIEVLVDGNEDV